MVAILTAIADLPEPEVHIMVKDYFPFIDEAMGAVYSVQAKTDELRRCIREYGEHNMLNTENECVESLEQTLYFDWKTMTSSRNKNGMT